MLFTPIKPMLVAMGKEAFDDDRYIFEPKWDGWRILIHKHGDRVEAYTRNGRNVTEKFPELRELDDSIRTHTAILDCEGVCIRDGRSVFDDFQYRGRLADSCHIAKARITHPATFVAFEVLYTDRPHTDEPLMDRKQRLNEIVEDSDVLIQTMYVEGRGKALSQLTIDRGWEGIVAKRKDSKYLLNSRTTDWTKIKNWKTIDTVILGYRLKPYFALVVGLHFPTVRNKPVATVEYGFKPEEKLAFIEIAKRIHTVKDKHTQWIEPKLCCRIQYLERTDNHHLRTVSFQGFLFGKDPEDCRWVS
jgi:bifunctional non-homologous end joining protein LigD